MSHLKVVLFHVKPALHLHKVGSFALIASEMVLQSNPHFCSVLYHRYPVLQIQIKGTLANVPIEFTIPLSTHVFLHVMIPPILLNT